MEAYKVNEAARENVRKYPHQHRSYTFRQGANWLMQQPLADRLTEEEKAELMADFNRCKLLANKDYRDGRIVTYANIFGKELFNEK